MSVAHADLELLYTLNKVKLVPFSMRRTEHLEPLAVRSCDLVCNYCDDFVRTFVMSKRIL